MNKVLITATVQSHVCQFHRPLVELLREKGNYEIHVAARNNLGEKAGLELDFVDQVFDVPFERSPFDLKNAKAYWRLKKIIESNNYDYIHCNTPVGGVVTRLASKRARKSETQVIYTAHGFHFYKGASAKNWLLYYPVEWLLSWLTDVLITINKEDYSRAKKLLHAKKTTYLPGVGIDFAKFDVPVSEADRLAKRAELGVPAQARLLVSVGELNSNKNHQVVIQALAKLKDPNIHYCIAGGGRLRGDLIALSHKLGVGGQVHLLGYRRDVGQIYKAADVCCFPSKREGLPLSVLEAIACNVPVVAANNRGTRDIIINGESGILCQPNSVDAFVNGIRVVLEHPEIAESITQKAKKNAEQFSVEKTCAVLREIYKAQQR